MNTVKVNLADWSEVECHAGADYLGNVRLWPVTDGHPPYLISSDCYPGSFARAIGEARARGIFEDNYVESSDLGDALAGERWDGQS